MKLGVFVLILFLLPIIASARLVDNTNYAIQPNSQQCFDLNIPEDFGVIDTRLAFTINSNCGEWCDFSKSILTTDKQNPVVIPVCLNVKDKKTGNRQVFSLNIGAGGKQKIYNFGVCVHENQDKDTGKGDPCEVVNVKQDNFDITINPNPIRVESGKSATYEIHVYSQERFGIEIETSTGKKWNIQTEPKKSGGIVLTDSIGSDKTELSITGKITTSQGPGDKKTVVVPVYVTDQKPAGDFSISLTPENTNTRVNDAVNYQLEINNQGDQKTFNIEVKTPEEFKSDLTTISKTVSGKETINFQVTPTKAVSNPFRVIVSFNAENETGTKALQSYISVEEIRTDLGRAVNTENQSTKITKCMNSQNLQNKGKNIADQVDSWGNFLNCTQQPDSPDGNGSGTTQTSGGINPVFIILPIVVIAAALFYYFYKKKKPVKEEEEEYY